MGLGTGNMTTDRIDKMHVCVNETYLLLEEVAFQRIATSCSKSEIVINAMKETRG